MPPFESGFYEVTELGAGTPETRAATWQCCHCGAHRPYTPGMKQNGFCMRCNGYVCGRTCSGECKPLERMLDEMEGAVNPTAISIAVPDSKIFIPPGAR